MDTFTCGSGVIPCGSLHTFLCPIIQTPLNNCHVPTTGRTYICSLMPSFKNSFTISIMWNHLPFDLLANIFSFLPPDSFASAKSACKHWHTCGKAYPSTAVRSHHQSWFVGLPTNNNHSPFCYAHNPDLNKWHIVPLDFIPDLVQPVGSIGGLILFKLNKSTSLQLVICNLFTRQYKHLPGLGIKRINPAIGIVLLGKAKKPLSPYYKVYVAGGMSNMPSGGFMQEAMLEMYDSQSNTWRNVGYMPMELAIRLTVWAPRESVYSNGILYWITSARAYVIMGFEIETNIWHELSIPMAERLEWATLVSRNGKLTLVGSGREKDVLIWELGEGNVWCLIGKMPSELGRKYIEGKGSWGNIKCVGGDRVVCLYRNIGLEMVVWRENMEKGRWEWFIVEGCCPVRGKQINYPFKGVILHPNAPSIM